MIKIPISHSYQLPSNIENISQTKNEIPSAVSSNGISIKTHGLNIDDDTIEIENNVTENFYGNVTVKIQRQIMYKVYDSYIEMKKTLETETSNIVSASLQTSKETSDSNDTSDPSKELSYPSAVFNTTPPSNEPFNV